MQFFGKWNDKKIFAGKVGLIILLCLCCVAIVKLSMPMTAKSEIDAYKHVNTDETFIITEADENMKPGDAESIDLSDVSNVEICAAGEYVLTGKGSNTIVINSQDQIVHLFLDNVEVHTNCGPALLIKSAGKVIITIVKDSTNVLQDAAIYTGYEDYDAAIFSQADLTINGDGVLNVYGYYEDAIHTKDIIKVLGGQVFIQAKQDGIKGNDGALIRPQKLSIESEKYGVRTTKNGKQYKGDIDICAGDISIIAGEYAIVSGANLYVRECKLYCKSVVSDMDIAGDQFIDEGSYVNE